MADNNKALSGFSFVINSQSWGLKKISSKMIVINGAMLSRRKNDDGSYPAIVNCPKIKIVGEEVVSAIGDKLAPKVLVAIDEGFIDGDEYTKEDGTVKGEFVIGVTKAHIVEKKSENQTGSSQQPTQPPVQNTQPAPQVAPQQAAPQQTAPQQAAQTQNVDDLLAAMGIK